MGYKVIYDNGQILIKRVLLWRTLIEGIHLGEWYKTRKKGKYYLLTNYTVDVERIRKLVSELKAKIKQKEEEKIYFDEQEERMKAFGN